MQPQSSPTRLIPLTQGLWTLVDTADYERLRAMKWYASLDKGTGAFYAVRNVRRAGGGQRRQALARVVMDAPHGIEVDHVSRDTLDNRRCNLRLVTRSRNMQNSARRSDNSTGYKGVKQRRDGNWIKWQVQITIDGRRRHLGYFDDVIEAAQAYDTAAVKAFGEYARLNFPHI
jgi:hypothetical protein